MFKSSKYLMTLKTFLVGLLMLSLMTDVALPTYGTSSSIPITPPSNTINTINTIKPINETINANNKNVLLLYDRRNIYGYKNDEVTSIRELFGHFATTVTEMPYKDYQKGDFKKYDHLVLIGIENNMGDHAPLISDLKNCPTKILFIGEPFKLMKILKPGLIDIGKKNFNAINIQHRNFTKTIRFTRYVYAITPLLEGVIGTTLIGDGTRSTPYILTYKNWTLVTSVDTNDLLYYALADSLHEFFDENHDALRRAYLRIEDVHALRDYDQLKKVADYLYAENFPFMIVLIPAFMNTKNGKINILSDYPDFISTLKYMSNRGGSFILHGYTHQTQLKETGEGFEFWDGLNNSPITNIKALIDGKLHLGLKECLANGIEPLAFEAPHYALSHEGFQILKQYFSTYVGQLQTSDLGFTTVNIPYEIRNTAMVNRLLPENLGYVAENDPTSLQQIEQNLDDLDFVRDYTAGVFFHPYLNIDSLKRIVTLLKSKDDYSIIDLKHEDNWVHFESYDIVSSTKGIQSNYTPEVHKWDIRMNTYAGSIILAALVAFFCLAFAVIFVISRRRILRRTFKD